ncbi:GNAT family N-acetyltransferase [Staphylococcus auricularis]|nr:GNAT family N-acetyltransferase [Staphylococcus auricularis]
MVTFFQLGVKFTMLEIRTITQKEILNHTQFLELCTKKKCKVYAWNLYISKDSVEDYITTLLTNHIFNYQFIGAFDGEELVGIISLKLLLSSGEQHKAYLENLATKTTSTIEEEIIATALFDHIIELCNSKHIEILLTSVASNNISAKIFFSQHNFEMLAFEPNARKLDSNYIDEHWLSYHL